MKRYKRKFQEVSFEYYKGYKDRYIIATKHSIDRYIDRYSFISQNDLLKVISSVMKKIIEKYNDTTGTYGFHSKSTGIGGIINWRLDYKGKNKENNAVLVSLFPIKKFHTFRNVDAEILVEKQIILWAKEKGFNKSFFKFNLCESYVDEQMYIEDNFYVNFWNGKLYNSKLDGYILV